MKSFLKRALAMFRWPIDLLLSILIVPAAHLLLLYRKAGAAQLPMTTKRLKGIGVFPIRNHFYEPLFDDRLLMRPLDADRYLPGIDLNEADQLRRLDALRFEDELIVLDLRQRRDTIGAFHLPNGSFEPGDAEYLYQFLRAVKPAKVIEIGSGNSTKIARLALERNRGETGVTGTHICIEPYEQPWLEQLDGIEVIRRRVEDCDIDWSAALAKGDLLFVDSSHMIRPQGDVLKEYLEIFPRLQPGVVVHIHDIFTPRDYLKTWVVDEVRFWNEQYLLEALLTNTNRYEVVAALNYLKNNHYDALSRVCPYLDRGCEPGSFYFRVRAE